MIQIALEDIASHFSQLRIKVLRTFLQSLLMEVEFVYFKCLSKCLVKHKWAHLVCESQYADGAGKC